MSIKNRRAVVSLVIVAALGISMPVSDSPEKRPRPTGSAGKSTETIELLETPLALTQGEVVFVGPVVTETARSVGVKISLAESSSGSCFVTAGLQWSWGDDDGFFDHNTFDDLRVAPPTPGAIRGAAAIAFKTAGQPQQLRPLFAFTQGPVARVAVSVPGIASTCDATVDSIRFLLME